MSLGRLLADQMSKLVHLYRAQFANGMENARDRCNRT